MNKDFERIYKLACDCENVAPYEGILSHLMSKSFTDRDEAIVCAFLAGVFYQQEEKGGRFNNG